MIRFERVTRKYGDLTAVDDVTFEVGGAEVFGLLGSNGSGKTTLNKMLTGLLRPTAGVVTVGGVSPVDDPVGAKRQFGYLPENHFLYPSLTGYELLRFVAGMKNISFDSVGEDLRRLIEIFGLEDHIHRLIGTYSQGTKKKTAFLAALLGRPRVVILDEPTNGIDPPMVVLFKNIIAQLKKTGATVLVSSHNLPFIEQCADRVGILEKGRLTGVGSPGELRATAAAQKPGLQNATLEELFMHYTGRQIGSVENLFEP